jgi:hypothetical protein
LLIDAAIPEPVILPSRAQISWIALINGNEKQHGPEHAQAKLHADL